MNDDIYFNEPMYDREKGTSRGTMLNRGYSNIVRYANVKYAMVEVLRNTPKMFADIIRVQFYLKQQKIIAMVQQWIEEGRKTSHVTSYEGLV